MAETKELRKQVSLQNINSSSSPAKNPGTRIGPYLVGKTLGVGSTGRVKLGTHIETGQRVAIKIIGKAALLEKYAKDPVKQRNMSQKLEREITLMKLIQHPNIMQLYDVYETDRDLYLILEHIEGGELFDYLVKRGRLSESEALGFFQQIIYGVDFCHRNHICHRDLKPENLLLDKHLNIKIADFGMASLQVPSKMLETSCGSPHYASPEIIRGIKYDGTASDVWSCGIILYALLTGNLPFDDENIRRLLAKVKTGIYYMPEYLSSDARNLISRMLVVDPVKRIKMPEIMKHPWFISIPPKTPYLPAALETVGDTTFNPDMLDEDILKSLHLIGWGDEEQLKEKLSSNESNFEKVFYALLLQRKTDFFENYDINKLSEWDIEGGPRRRTESYNSLFAGDKGGSTKDLYRSTDTLVVPNSTPNNSGMNSPSPLGSTPSVLSSSYTNGMASGSGHKAEGSSSSVSNGSMKTLENQTSREELIKRQQKNAVHVNSPLATNLVVMNNTEENPSVPSHTKNESKSSVSTITSSSISPNHVSSGSSSVYNNITIKTDDKTTSHPSMNLTSPNRPVSLQINIPRNNIIEEIKGSDGGGGNNRFSLQVGTPKFHRRKDFPIPPSPVITSTPKKSWFANLFNFKPEAVTLLSESNTEETTSMIQDLMESLGIKYQEKREGGGFKCKWDGGPVPSAIVSAAKGQMIGGSTNGNTSASTGVDSMSGEGGGEGRESSSDPNSPNKRMSLFSGSKHHSNTNNNSQPSGIIIPSSENSTTTATTTVTATAITASPTATSPTSDNGLYTTPTSATGTQAGELQDNINNNMSTNTIWMKSVKFKIDILPASGGASSNSSSNVIGEMNNTTGSTKVVFTQQQGSYSSFQVVVYNIKSTWESCEKESQNVTPTITPSNANL